MNVLTPFGKGENDCKEFSVINVIVAFGGEKGMRKICTRMEVAIGIIL